MNLKQEGDIEVELDGCYKGIREMVVVVAVACVGASAMVDLDGSGSCCSGEVTVKSEGCDDSQWRTLLQN